jgi:putative DNA primase/helicase
MSLTGVVQDHVLLFCYGTGANGKSTLINTVQEMMGSDYAMKAPPDLLMVKSAEGHPTERADLAGKRFVACVEAGEGRRLAESLVKELTGGDRVRARRMREDFWEFSPSHKVWLAANHKPVVRGTDRGIWRRIKLIPFTVAIPEERQDKKLPGKLKGELPGILNWALLGCIEWQATGLGEPESVRRATAEYRSESDILGAFLDECCIVGDGCEAPASLLYNEYHRWAEASGEKPITQTAFGNAMTERGFVSDRFTGGFHKGRKKWGGVGLRAPSQQGTSERSE